MPKTTLHYLFRRTNPERLEDLAQSLMDIYFGLRAANKEYPDVRISVKGPLENRNRYDVTFKARDSLLVRSALETYARYARLPNAVTGRYSLFEPIVESKGKRLKRSIKTFYTGKMVQ